MSKKEKLRLRLLSKPSDYTWNELQTLLKYLGSSDIEESMHYKSVSHFGDMREKTVKATMIANAVGFLLVFAVAATIALSVRMNSSDGILGSGYLQHFLRNR